MASKSPAHTPRRSGPPPKPKPSALRARALRWAGYITLLAVLVQFYQYMNSINHIFYKLDPETLHSITKEAINRDPNITAIIPHVISRIKEEYPDVRFQDEWLDRSEWVWNNAGGAMGSMFIIHASISEYLIIFGSAVGTEGHTGRHTADDYFHILSGTQTAYLAGELHREEYPPGSVHWLKRGETKQYRFEGECWALEYARGWIPLMLPFGFADTLFSTLDLGTLYHTVRLTGREMVANLLRGKI